MTCFYMENNTGLKQVNYDLFEDLDIADLLLSLITLIIGDCLSIRIYSLDKLFFKGITKMYSTGWILALRG